MPRKGVDRREALLEAAFSLVRSEGEGALCARRIAERAGCSVQPIYAAFGDMDTLTEQLRAYCAAWLEDFVRAGMGAAHDPFEAVGLSHVRLAREEPHLFAFLYLSPAHPFEGFSGLYANVAMPEAERYLANNPQLDAAGARWLYLKLILFTHGMASLVATGAATLTDEEIHAQMHEACRAFYAAWQNGEGKVRQ